MPYVHEVYTALRPETTIQLLQKGNISVPFEVSDVHIYRLLCRDLKELLTQLLEKKLNHINFWL